MNPWPPAKPSLDIKNFGEKSLVEVYRYINDIELSTTDRYLEITSLSIKLALAIAVVDGAPHKKEAEVVKAWGKNRLARYSGMNHQLRKSHFNSVNAETQNSIRTGCFDRTLVAKELKRLGKRSDHYKVLDLLLSVMAADRIAHESEIEFINTIGAILDIPKNQIQKQKDLLIIESSIVLDAKSLPLLLGIDASWTKKKNAPT